MKTNAKPQNQLEVTLPPGFAELLTPPQVAKIVGLDARTLANWRASGAETLPYMKVGGRIRYSPEDVQEWLKGKRAS